jgi:hypothetical protein
MTLRDALSIAIPGVALVALFVVPGELRWTRRPWFIDGRALSRRWPIAIFGAFLVLAIAHALF